ncbi:uncharacterized protein LOC131073707 isoform X1 [Cryptomeria japonica]|uniref:uncharacterized protein LOC131073707 isoform X1 n=1 Tax=Cryptomeria japonica TaxID=3369 RepID=UPI0027DA930A|nr:uncharacterized protein LOC131073707 isoform X1 [Cryptomeria japonica]
MDTRALSSGTVPQFLLPLQTNLHMPSLTRLPVKKKMPRFAVKAVNSGDSEHRNIVDEDMLVLRKRMHEVRMEEINYIPPQHWMEWEKKWYTTYDSDVCSSLLWLQNILLNTRPGVAVAIVALISLSVAASLLEIPIHLKEIITELLNNLHL